MTDNLTQNTGRHFLQIPGPTNVPDRVLRAIDQPVIDHRSTDFSDLVLNIIEKLKQICKTTQPVLIYPSSGSGAWESALVNTLSQNDRVLMYETGHFAMLWYNIALKLGIKAEMIKSDWRQGVNPSEIESRLLDDKKKTIKAVIIIHNETSTGVESNILAVRKAIDKANHPALLMVDAVSSLGSIDYRHDEWGIDVTVSASQKGLMLPPGLGINVVSEKALNISNDAKLPKSYWDWNPILDSNKTGFYPYTPATNLLFGLNEALTMLLEEGLNDVFIRHKRFAKATQEAVRKWGLELQCRNSSEYSNTLTAVRVPEDHDADVLRDIILEKFNMSLGTGLGKVKGKVFRIGHLGYFNELMLAGTLCGIEMGLDLAEIPHNNGGIQAGLEILKNFQ